MAARCEAVALPAVAKQSFAGRNTRTKFNMTKSTSAAAWGKYYEESIKLRFRPEGDRTLDEALATHTHHAGQFIDDISIDAEVRRSIKRHLFELRVHLSLKYKASFSVYERNFLAQRRIGFNGPYQEILAISGFARMLLKDGQKQRARNWADKAIAFTLSDVSLRKNRFTMVAMLELALLMIEDDEPGGTAK